MVVLNIPPFFVGVTLWVGLLHTAGREQGIDVVLVEHLHHMILIGRNVH